MYVNQKCQDKFSTFPRHIAAHMPQDAKGKTMNDMMTMAVLTKELSKHHEERRRHAPVRGLRLKRTILLLSSFFSRQ